MIFWKHIKGLSATNVYSFIRFQGVLNEATIVDGKKMTNLPQLWLNSSTTFNPQSNNINNINCGYILTSDMTEGCINNAFTFFSSVKWKYNVYDENTFLDLYYANASAQWLFSTDQNIKILSNQGKIEFYAKDNFVVESNKNITISNSSESTTSNSTITITSNNKEITLNNHIKSNKINLTSRSSDPNEVYDGSCTATYFNATSDYRAKKDFKLLDIDALELIKKVQLYSFKYKDSNQPSIGIIAQDVQDINIDGFDLVDNKEASGANFDYMSIHESKLVYILWKAIQEQQKEIEELKKLIK